MKQLIDETNRAPIMQQKSEEFLQLRADLLKSRRAVHVLTGKDAENVSNYLVVIVFSYQICIWV